MSAEGWHEDPFAVHEARWFSDGRPTALVRCTAPAPRSMNALGRPSERTHWPDLRRLDRLDDRRVEVVVGSHVGRSIG